MPDLIRHPPSMVAAKERWIPDQVRDDGNRSTSSNAFTAAAGPSACPHTAAHTARKSAPASTSARPFSGVMPPIATQGISKTRDHQERIEGSGRWSVGLVVVGKKAPKAT